MSNEVVSIIVNITLTVVAIVGYLYLSVLMAKEVTRPKDKLTPLRWRIFAAVFVIVMTLIPSLIYQILRLYGLDTDLIRNIVTITARINSIGALAILFAVFTYRMKDR
jgi:hypothetical protein